jgi:hypothetical protein
LVTALLIPSTAQAASTSPANATANVELIAPEAMVTSTVQNADGTITETIYDPAPGVTPTQLAQNLRASGLGNVTVQDAACTNGSAVTWPSDATCFVRWSYNGAVRPIINFVDHSSSAWPVGRAVTVWNKTSGIDSIYRTATTGCDGAPVHCVHVYSADYGANGSQAETNRTFNAAHTYYASATVKLNNHYSGSETTNWSTACHELGHVLGLGHNTSTSSCTYYMGVSNRSKYPLGNDYDLLERYY